MYMYIHMDMYYVHAVWRQGQEGVGGQRYIHTHRRQEGGGQSGHRPLATHIYIYVHIYVSELTAAVSIMGEKHWYI